MVFFDGNLDYYGSNARDALCFGEVAMSSTVEWSEPFSRRCLSRGFSAFPRAVASTPQHPPSP
jgi:hypothetical protein